MLPDFPRFFQRWVRFPFFVGKRPCKLHNVRKANFSFPKQSRMWEKALGNHLPFDLNHQFSLSMPPRDAKVSRRGTELRDKLSLAMDEGFHATCQAISCYRKASFCLLFRKFITKSGYNFVSQEWPWLRNTYALFAESWS